MVPVMIFIRKTGVIYIFGDTPDSRDVIRQFAQKPSSSRAKRTSRTWKSCLICSRTTRMCRTPTTTGRPRTKPYIARVSAVLKPFSCDIQGSSCDMHNNLCCDRQRGLLCMNYESRRDYQGRRRKYIAKHDELYSDGDYKKSNGGGMDKCTE